jgi:GST-like protein
MTEPFRLITTKGCGSAITEACLELAGLPYVVEEIDYAVPGPAQDRLRALNALGQVPTLILPSGAVMTESAAMALHIADFAPASGLVPSVGDPERPAFLRWLVFLVATIYPTFTFGDEPARYVTGEAAERELRQSTDTYRERCWRMVEEAAQARPYFLGERFSVLDVYLSVMSRWRPRRPWFAEHCPKLHSIAKRIDAEPLLAAVWARNQT